MRATIAAVLLSGLMACTDTVEPTDSTVTAQTRIFLITPTGNRSEITGRQLDANSPDLLFEIELNVAGDLLITTDGSEPRKGAAGTTQAARSARINVSESTTVRWFAVTNDGRRTEARALEVSFDRDPPTIEFDPEPGKFAQSVTVTVTADESARLLYTTDGRAPIEGLPGTQAVDLPVELELRETVQLVLVAEDRVGNRSAPTDPLVYEVDSSPPSTTVDPPAGQYLGPVTVRLDADDPDATIRYTLAEGEPERVYEGPIEIDSDARLRFSAVDEGGNVEPVQSAQYVVGPRPARTASRPGPIDDHPVAEVLWLAGALVDAAGVLSGRDAPGFGRDWNAWAAGREAADAFLFRSGVGPDAIRSAPIIALASSDNGAADENNNGTNADDTWWARLDAMVERAGAVAPQGVFVPTLFYTRAVARLTAPLSDTELADGRPLWAEDWSLMRWDRPSPGGRSTGADALAGGLRALAARARSATVARHPVGENLFAESVAPVVGLRCAGCHRVGGVEPRLDTAATLAAAGVYTPGDESSALVDLLDGTTPHGIDPATPEQVDAVRAWIASGAELPALQLAVGVNGDEGFAALLATEQAALAIGDAFERIFFDAREEGLRRFDSSTTEPRWPVAEAEVTEGAANDGLPPRVEVRRALDERYRTAEQARVLRAAVAVHGLEARPLLFVEGDPLRSAPEMAERLLRHQAATLIELVVDPETGAVAESWSVGEGASAQIDTAAQAEAVVALWRAHAVAPELDADDAAHRAADFLREVLDDGRALYANGFDGEATQRSRRRSLATQLAVLEALVIDAQSTGDAADRAAAVALWARLDALWWDADAGAWQTELGSPDYLYTPALAARALDAVGAAIEAGVAEDGAERLQRFYDEVVSPLRLAESWVQGEVGEGDDADDDGVPRPQGVSLGNGAPPTFAPALER